MPSKLMRHQLPRQPLTSATAPPGITPITSNSTPGPDRTLRSVSATAGAAAARPVESASAAALIVSPFVTVIRLILELLARVTLFVTTRARRRNASPWVAFRPAVPGPTDDELFPPPEQAAVRIAKWLGFWNKGCTP